METIWRQEVGKQIKGLDVTDESVKIIFEDETNLCFRSQHDQDCYEHVYADFSIVSYHSKEIMEEKTSSIEMKAVPGAGFLLVFNRKVTWNNKEESYEKVFIPCYNFQNGYYSDQLSIEIVKGNTTEKVDVSSLIEDHID